MAKTVPTRINAPPNKSNKYYLAPGGGGYNNSITPAYPSVLPNCVGYARGRFAEICGYWNNPPEGNGGQIYDIAKNAGWSVGQIPMVGAMIVWARPGHAGHVAVVERINLDKSLVISQSGYKDGYSFSNILDYKGNYNSIAFSNATIQAPAYKFGSSYYFKGFVYNPKVQSGEVTVGGQGYTNKLQDFVTEAGKHIGEDYHWTSRMSGLGPGQHWCAAFVVACRNAVGGLDDVIAMSYGAGQIVRQYASVGNGTFETGPAQGNYNAQPQVGDLVLFRWESPAAYRGQDKYFADHVEIVVKVSSYDVTTIGGNTGGGCPWYSHVNKHTYSRSSKSISGFYHPDWSKVGCDGYMGTSSGGVITPLYSGETLNDKNDAAIREVGYIASNLEPTTSKTNIKLSVINYTNGLAAIFNNLVLPNYVTTGGPSTLNDYNLDNIDGVPRAIAEYFFNKGYNKAYAVGWLCNIEAECGFKIGLSVVDSNGLTSGGIVMWNGSNYNSMVRHVGQGWRTDLTGQLDFLEWQLESNRWFGSIHNSIKQACVGNTLEAAQNTAYTICTEFERPANKYTRAQERAAKAQKFWNSIVTQPRSNNK